MLYIKENTLNTLYSNNLISGTTQYYMNIDGTSGVSLFLATNNTRYSTYYLTTTGVSSVNYSLGKINIPNDIIYNYSIYYLSGGTQTVETGLIRQINEPQKPFKAITKKDNKKFISRG